MPRAPHPRVALLIETSKGYGRQLLLGVRRYLDLHGPWSIVIGERGLDDPEPPWLRGWRGDGILTRCAKSEATMEAVRRGIPAINLRYWEEFPGGAMPNVDCDQAAIAKCAADHLIDSGFRSLAYCGLRANLWSDARREAFRQIAASRSPACTYADFETDDPGVGSTWEREQKALTRWLTSLPAPTGILACNDVQGVRILDACREAGIAVPDRIAVVGVDNDPVFCGLSDPPLSSVDQNVAAIGFRAAEMLDAMMRGGDPEPEPRTLLPPAGVAARRSSDAVACPDPAIARALRFIRERHGIGIDVDQVAAAAHVSKRLLQSKFKAVLDRTPVEEIQRARLRRARDWLTETDEPLASVADRMGFAYQSHFATWFRRQCGETPAAVRKSGRWPNWEAPPISRR